MQTDTAYKRLSNYDDVPVLESPIGTYISLYAGAGGLDLGFALAGFAPFWVSELDSDALRTNDAALHSLASDRPHLRDVKHTSVVGDLLRVDSTDLPKRGSADVVIGGPPCQGFSVAGKMDPKDSRSEHVFHFFDIVEQVNPKAFVLENVKALYANSRWTHVREALLGRARSLGYETQLNLVNAADFGVPQARERMFLIGVRDDVGSPLPLVPTSSSNRPTVREALSQLPEYGTPGNDTKCTARITMAKVPVLRRSPFAGMLFNGAGRPLDLDSPSLTLAASMGGNKTPIIDQSLLDSGDGPSWVREYHSSLRSGAVPGAVDAVPSSLRRLTVEEAAAIQTFPSEMTWFGRQSSKFRQIGNAVPPRLALAAARSVRAALVTQPADSIDA